MRGAYECGVVQGIMQALGRRPEQEPLFKVLSGTSVGAINAAFLASNADLGDHGVDALAQVWSGLKLQEHLQLRPFGVLPYRSRKLLSGLGVRRGGNSLLDARRIERTVREAIDFPKIHQNLAQGKLSALLVAALHVVSGRTTVFAEVASTEAFTPSLSAPREALVGPISAAHVLASAAIPLLFPTRQIDGRFYCDGGLRYNTPIAPAIRAGADRLVVISVSHRMSEREKRERRQQVGEAEAKDLSPLFVVGKLLNALLLDPVRYDLSVIERLNQLVDILESSLSDEQYQKVQRHLEQTRGAGYRRIPIVAFTPSVDLGNLAGDYLRDSLDRTQLNWMTRGLLRRAARGGLGREADWASYLLFDGGFARQLIELGRKDAIARSDELVELFGYQPQ